MDIAAHPKLDPKLKETYDRIMGTSLGVKMPHAAPPEHHVTHADGAPKKTHQESSHHAPAKETDHPAAPVHQAPGHLSHIAYSASSVKKTEEPKKAGEAAIKTDSLLFPIIMGAGGVIFFVFYAIFWMSFFGV